jgi:predicted ester cyclase
MSPTTGKEIFRRFHEEVLVNGNYDAIDELVDANVVSHNPLPEQQPGSAGLKDTLRMFRAAFPDLTSKATLMIAEGDVVAGRFEVAGSHQGEFMGLKPTGEKFTYEEMIFVRVKNGRIIEHWAVADTLDMMLKTGAIENKAR